MVRILPRSLSLGTALDVRTDWKPTSPESMKISDLFQKLVSANTFSSVMEVHQQICEHINQDPTNIDIFFPILKSKLRSWKTKVLWSTLDERANRLCYNRGRACKNIKVLVIGAGPAGLRSAIECQMLGAKVVVLDKRSSFSRNNVLHLWPFVIQDLKDLGAKTFYGKFCSGSIDHVSIRTLQLILLKVALLLGVEVHENVTFLDIREPSTFRRKKVGWRAKVLPKKHPVSSLVFDVLIGAGGAQTNLPGFVRTEDRHKLAIAVTANFVNHKTPEEVRVPEISGVAYIFNQKFFQDMKAKTGVDLENIVYYKDETHYFIMTAKKQSLLDQKVLLQDHRETSQLLDPANVDTRQLMAYARKAASTATEGKLSNLEFSDTNGKTDLSIFDFTNLFRSDKACVIKQVRGHKLLTCLVGDSLLEPFWPTGSGCAYAFLSALDTAWAIRNFALGMDSSKVLEERELCFRNMRDSKPENVERNMGLEPTIRYKYFTAAQ